MSKTLVVDMSYTDLLCLQHVTDKTCIMEFESEVQTLSQRHIYYRFILHFYAVTVNYSCLTLHQKFAILKQIGAHNPQQGPLYML